MNITVKRCTWRRKPRCRYCKESAQWDLIRDTESYSPPTDRVCDKHLGVALRNLGLTRLTIEHTAVCAAQVRP